MNNPTWEKRTFWQQRPDQPVVMYQSWQRLAFLHWQVPEEWLASKLPVGLQLDTFDGQAWLGIVPFAMRNIRPAGLPSVPYISNFLELNVRTYVLDQQGRPGVWFFSLSANRSLAVWAARTFFHLPYFCSRMSEEINADGEINYACQRWQQPKRAKRIFEFQYLPQGSAQPAEIGTLEFFLAERYLLFAANPKLPGKFYCGQVHHPPYQTSPLKVTSCDPSILALDGLYGSGEPDPLLSSTPDHAMYCEGVDVEVFGLQT